MTLVAVLIDSNLTTPNLSRLPAQPTFQNHELGFQGILEKARITRFFPDRNRPNPVKQQFFHPPRALLKWLAFGEEESERFLITIFSFGHRTKPHLFAWN